MYECTEVTNTALHNFPRPQAFKKEITNENQEERKIFDPGGIWTHDLRIRGQFVETPDTFLGPTTI